MYYTATSLSLNNLNDVFIDSYNIKVVSSGITTYKLYILKKQFLGCFMKTLKELSELLVRERKKRALSQKDMRMLIGMSQQQYQRVESGQDLKVSTLFRILAGLGLELSISDPSDLDSKRAISSNVDAENIWVSKQKHLED